MWMVEQMTTEAVPLTFERGLMWDKQVYRPLAECVNEWLTELRSELQVVGQQPELHAELKKTLTRGCLAMDSL